MIYTHAHTQTHTLTLINFKGVAVVTTVFSRFFRCRLGRRIRNATANRFAPSSDWTQWCVPARSRPVLAQHERHDLCRSHWTRWWWSAEPGLTLRVTVHCVPRVDPFAWELALYLRQHPHRSLVGRLQQKDIRLDWLVHTNQFECVPVSRFVCLYSNFISIGSTLVVSNNTVNPKRLAETAMAIDSTILTDTFNWRVYLYCRQIREELLPTPLKFHYTFSLRELSRWLQGLLQSSHERFKGPKKFLRLWRHECLRVFRDRIMDEEDLEALNVSLPLVDRSR